ncbi:MAG: hypothetical protein NT061_08660 [Spirochaetes bacterium]|nr:hypothetical protein [Spirochaetota bacterium]
MSCSEWNAPPEVGLLESLISGASAALAGEKGEGRPLSGSGLPGGLVRVSDVKIIIIPDLHARPRLIRDLLRSPLPGSSAQVAEALAAGEVSVLCLGDIIHSEGQEAAARWIKAADRIVRARGLEGLLGPEMEAEMTLSLSALLEAAFLQILFPGRFRCLKGNHDNLGNRSTEGDSPFGKYSLEGLMGAEWFTARYGQKAMEFVRSYELLLPLVAAGRSFCASHAEPAFALGPEDLLEYRFRPDLVRALIWTRDGEAEESAVAASLEAILGPVGRSRFWVAGHRALPLRFHLRKEDGFLQIHDPSRSQVLLIDEGKEPGQAEVKLYSVDPELGLTESVRISPRS